MRCNFSETFLFGGEVTRGQTLSSSPQRGKRKGSRLARDNSNVCTVVDVQRYEKENSTITLIPIPHLNHPNSKRTLMKSTVGVDETGEFIVIKVRFGFCNIFTVFKIDVCCQHGLRQCQNKGLSV